MTYFKGKLSKGKARILSKVQATEESLTPQALGILAFIGSSSSMVERLTVAQETRVRFSPSALWPDRGLRFLISLFPIALNIPRRVK